MTPRTIHIGASFAIVLVAYSAYALMVVPWIEPALKPIVVDPGTKHRLLPDPDRNDLNVLFPPGAWQHTAKIINSDDKAMLLWQRYQVRQNGWVDLTPLTVIFLPRDDEYTDPKERMRHAMVMEVPEGANLRFDKPLDPTKSGGIGHLIEGHLRGPVQIRSQGKKPDHSDDLFVDTHDVDLTEQRITTASDVDFRMGPNYGRGRQMEIKLLPRSGSQTGNQDVANIGGIEQFQLEHVDHLHLEMASPTPAAAATAMPSPGTTPTVAGPAHSAGRAFGPLASHSGPVEITCRGPFCFDMVKQVATFRDQVDVLRSQPNGPSDRLSCELLSIFFARPAPHAGAAPSKPGGSGFDLEPTRIEALGTPTTVTAPTDHVQIRAERLQYNLKDQQICLEDSQEVIMIKDGDEIHAPNLCYTPGPPNHTQQFKLLAAGPGWLRGSMAKRPGQQLEAHWREKLEARPQDQNEVISLLGGATLDFHAMGRLDAQEIHFWLHETPPDAAGVTSVKPERLLAVKNVVGDAPQLSIKKVDRLEVWFTSLSPAAAAASHGLASAGPAPNGPARTYLPSTLDGPALGQAAVEVAAPASAIPTNAQPLNAVNTLPAVAGSPASPLSPASPQSPAPQSPGPQSPLGMTDRAAEGRKSHLEISGRLLRACVLLRDQPPSRQPREQSPQNQPPLDQPSGELTEVTVVDNVSLIETQTSVPGDRPLLVTGQWLHATEANSPQAKIEVKGEPAHMEGRGMSLTGPNIFIDRGGNVLSMEGPGAMEQFLDHDLENHPLPKGTTLKINWQKNMLFDGRKAHFQDSVNVVSDAKLLQTGVMDVIFQQPVSFSDLKPQQQPKVERIVCGGGVFVENRTIKEGQPVSYDRMELQSLDLNNITGDFHGDGPGKLISVSRGSNQGFSLPGGPLAGASRGATNSPVSFGPQASQAADPNQLMCLHLRFMRAISGNRLRNDIVFHGQVRAARAPVDSWTATLESDDPIRLGPQAFVLYCDTMHVATSPGQGSSNNMELTALDNVTVVDTSTNITARSARLTYTRAKELAILEGDGRSDAVVWKQDDGAGHKASRFAAQKLEYYTITKEVKVEGARAFELNQAPGGQVKPRAN